MIYNLLAHLRTTLTSLTFVADGWNETSASDSIVVRDTGGTDDQNNGRRDYTIQVMSRGQSLITAKESIQSAYNELRNRFGLVLPEAIVNGVTYPEAKACRIVPLQTPGYLGVSDENYHMYSFNVVVTPDYS